MSRLMLSNIVGRMKKGVQVQKEREAVKLAGEAEIGYPKNIKFIAKEGIQIPVSGYPYPYPMPPGAPKPPEKKKLVGISVVPTEKPGGKPIKIEEKESLAGVNISYPMVPEHPKQNERVYAYVNIKWIQGELHYLVGEPKLEPGDKEIIEKIKSHLEDILDVDLNKLGHVKAKQVLRSEIISAFSIVPGLPDERKSVMMYYMERDFLGMGKIDVLMRDPNIEDISCDGVGVPMYIFHRDPKFGSMKTNVTFETAEELNAFVSILAQRCKKSISIADPLLDGSLPGGSRVQATLGTDIARKGSNFTIRKFTEKPLTPTHMLKYGTLDSTQLAYLWLAVENGQSILVSGGTATGKTSLLNALSLFIRPGIKVVSIEDTPELRLPLPHWIPHVARSPLAVKGRIGEVTLFDLLKSSLRQRPDYIIVGEVRGREAFVLFQQIATGHPSLATIHAATIPQLIDRLITPPISLPPSLIENVDIMVFLTLSRLMGSYVRRANNILEVTGVKDNLPETLTVFQWKPVTDNFNIEGKSVVMKKISDRLGLTEESIQAEIFRRKKVLDWMLEKDIFDYRDVAKVISTYYSNPERVMDAVEAGE